MNSLINSNQLQELIFGETNLLICDCRFDLHKLSAGSEAYSAGHIPGAIYIDLDKDLSDTKNGTNGRHPLPTLENWAKTKQRLGIDSALHVIAYDGQGSAFASRLWWMLRATGHHKVQVLDGGFESWKGAVSTVKRVPTPLHIQPETRKYEGLVLADAVLKNLASHSQTILDARAPDRFHGQNETLDSAGGHIPGAINRFFKDNLESGEFKSPEMLRNEFSALLGNIQASDVIHQCGSGVTACHNLLAMESAGLGSSLLYAGSWSEWCSDPTRPIEL